MSFLKVPIISNLFRYFRVFYGYVGKKLGFLCLLVFFGGLCDSFGLSMLLPLLNVGKTDASLDSYTRFIHQFISSMGLPVSLYTILMFMIAAFFLKGAFIFIQNAVYAGVTANLAKEFRLNMVRKYTDMRYDYYINTNIGYLNNIITKEIDRAVGGFNKYVTVIVNVVYIVLYSGVAILLNWTMTVTAIAMSMGLFMLFRTFAATIRELSLRESELNASIQDILIPAIYNFKYLKATKSFVQLRKQLDKQIMEYRDVTFRSTVINALPKSLLEPLAVILLSGLIIAQTALTGHNISESLVLLVFFYKTFSRVFGFQQVWQHFCAFVGGVEVVEQASRVLEVNKERCTGQKLNRFKHNIVLRNVNFSYGKRQVLFDIDLMVAKNKSIGIVGESGAGKTTLFDILVGLIIPQSGSICIDSIDYSQIELSSLRQMIGYVTQEPVVFNDTIANNISFWGCDYADKACRERIERAAELGNCAAFIKDAENGYNTFVGDKGIKLSGGQRQRLAIAREIFKEPYIMIFDEATSSLDTESEGYIQQSINRMKGSCTLVIIAHRLSTIKNCDFIYVLDKGRIIQSGTFDQLYSDKNSRFFRMCEAQEL